MGKNCGEKKWWEKNVGKNGRKNSWKKNCQKKMVGKNGGKK